MVKTEVISSTCPAISTFVTNCYTTPARLFVIGSTEIRSNEGTTQGDPVAMAIYAIGITPLIMMMIELVTTRCDDIKIPKFGFRKTKRRIRYHNVLVTTKNFSLMRSILLCIRGSRGKNVNQEEANKTSDIQMSESLSAIREQ